MPTKCMPQIDIPSVTPPAIAHSFAMRPVLSRMRCAWSSVANEPMIAISTDKKTSGVFQEIGKANARLVYKFSWVNRVEWRAILACTGARARLIGKYALCALEVLVILPCFCTAHAHSQRLPITPRQGKIRALSLVYLSWRRVSPYFLALMNRFKECRE